MGGGGGRLVAVAGALPPAEFDLRWYVMRAPLLALKFLILPSLTQNHPIYFYRALNLHAFSSTARYGTVTVVAIKIGLIVR